jgi:hypothetical protein
MCPVLFDAELGFLRCRVVPEVGFKVCATLVEGDGVPECLDDGV